MARLLIMCLTVLALLFACGRVIIVELPARTAAVGAYAPDGAVPSGYERFLSPASHNFRFSWPGEPVRRGAVSERFEMRDGDCADSDCPAGRLRAELREGQKAPTSRVGKDVWYGWSFYNASMGAVTRDRSLGIVLGQWKLGADQPPVFRIVQTAKGALNWASCNPAICNPVGSEAEDVVAELEDMRVAGNWGAAQNFGDVCRLFSMEDARGKWTDIVINTNFAAAENGYLRIWVNGVLRCNYYGRMVSVGRAGAVLNHRRGIFASYTKPWRDTQGAATVPTMTAYYDEFLSGRDRSEVDTRAREAAGLRPKD